MIIAGYGFITISSMYAGQSWHREISQQEQQEGAMHGLYGSGEYSLGRGPSQQQSSVPQQEAPLVPQFKKTGTAERVPPTSTINPGGKQSPYETPLVPTQAPKIPASTNDRQSLASEQKLPISTPPQAAPRTAGQSDLEQAIEASKMPS